LDGEGRESGGENNGRFWECGAQNAEDESRGLSVLLLQNHQKLQKLQKPASTSNNNSPPVNREYASLPERPISDFPTATLIVS
jgi:hypothetical protein